MNPFTTAVFAVVNGEKVQVGWANEADREGGRTVKLFPLYDHEETTLEELSFIDNYKAKEQEQVDRSELGVEQKPATRSEAKTADKA